MKGSRGSHSRPNGGNSPVPSGPAAPARPSRGLIVAICVALTLAILAVYGQTFRFGYVLYDDNLYVYQNVHLQGGISMKNLEWAWTSFETGNWHPLTWMSFLLDEQLFGLNPGAQHAENVAFHAIATILLFLALLRMTGQLWRAAVVAGMLALHPLHVESVAWISERKDVICAVFEMLALLFYASYVRAPNWPKYVAVAASFLLSLLAKPMAVTLPFLLLLLDVWPLRRIPQNKPARLILEKLPLVALAAASCLVTMAAQASGGALDFQRRLSLIFRLENSIVGYARYLFKAIWPVDLAVLYPLEIPPGSLVFLSALVLAGFTAIAVFSYRKRPYSFVGWFWFVGMLVPVIGLVQAGLQAIADRYVYLPLVGLSLAVVWVIADILDRRAVPRWTGATLAMAVLGIQAGIAYGQAGYWRSSEALFTHTLAITSNNYTIENNLGAELQNQGRHAEAAPHLQRSLALNPGNPEAHYNLGLALAGVNDIPGAVEQYRQAVATLPTHLEARLHLGHELVGLQQYGAAIAELLEALRLDPNSADAEADLGIAYASQEELSAGLPHIERAIQLKPENAEARHNLCVVLLGLKRIPEALAACRKAMEYNRDSAATGFQLGRALAAAGDTAEAVAQFQSVLQMDPNDAGAARELQKLGIPPGGKAVR